MKILLSTLYFLYPSSNGGAQMCRSIANGLRNAGHDVVVSCIDFRIPRDKDYVVRWVEQDGLRVFTIRPSERHPGFVKPLWRMRPDPAMSAVAQNLIETEKPDIVYVNAGWEIGEFVFAAKKAGIPAVFHVHCFAHMCARQFMMDGNGNICCGPESPDKCFSCLQTSHTLRRRLLENFSAFTFGKHIIRLFLGKDRAESFLLKQAVEEAFEYFGKLRDSVDKWIATSQLIADIHKKYDYPYDRFHILPHFLPDDRLKRLPHERQNKRICFGFFGRMSAEKGFELLTDALCKAEKQLSDKFDLCVISREANQADIVAKFGKAGISPERIHVFNNLTGSDLNPVLANLDICIIPSLWNEIGPLTMLEAIAQGVSCVVSDSVGMSSLIQDEINGRLFPVGNVNALKDILMQLLKQPDIAQKWREKLPKIAGEEEYTEKLTSIFQSVIE